MSIRKDYIIRPHASAKYSIFYKNLYGDKNKKGKRVFSILFPKKSIAGLDQFFE